MELDKIYLGDCYQLIKNVPDKSIDLIITDPPYEFCEGGKGKSTLSDRADKNKYEIYMLDTELTKKKLTSGGGCFGTKKRDYYSQIDDTDVNMSAERKEYLDYVKAHGKDEESERLRVIANAIDNRQNTHFVSKGITNEILDEMCRVMKRIYIYIWCNKQQLRQLIDYFDDKGCFIDLLTWHKTNPIPTCNNTYLSDTEYCVFARESGAKLYGTVETKKKFYVSQTNVADKKLYEHPTIKPLEIIKNFIINAIDYNNFNQDFVVMDCFMGSGTTAVAAKELGVHYIGYELNERFWNIANERLQGISKIEKQAKEDGLIPLF